MPGSAYRAGVFTYDYVPPIGGGGRHVAEVCKRLDGQVLVFSGQRNELEHHVGVLSRWRHGFLKQLLLSLWLNLRIKAQVRRFGLAKTNVHTGPGGLFLLRRAGVPVVATAHHTYWQQARHVPSQRWKRVLVPLERRTLRLAEKVVCVSADTRRAVVEHYGIAAGKTVVIPNGIDPAVFRPRPELERIPKSVLFLSRLERRKGIDFLLRALRRVVAEDREVKLFVGGEGSLRPALEAYVREHALGPHVTFLGFVPEDRLCEWYARAGVFVMPSVFEGFGIPVLEAMAVGTPVVGTAVDGIAGLIDDGKTGLLVDYGDEEGLARRILQVLHGGFAPPPDLADRIRREYDWDTLAHRYREWLL